MGRLDTRLLRLLKVAAQAKDDVPGEMPFGFETRILARWRELRSDSSAEVARFVRRVAIGAIVVTLFGAVIGYNQLRDEEETNEPLTNDYALVDSTIQNQLLR